MSLHDRKRVVFSFCATTCTHAQVRILGDGTQELTTPMTDRLEKEVGITIVSFAPAGIMAGKGAMGVVTRVILVVEEKMALMLLLVLLIFPHLYYSHNMNTRKEN